MKRDIYGGHDPRDLAVYTVADAARIVRMNAATVRTWAFGRTYRTSGGDKRWPPLLVPADKTAKQLSFRNLVELHVLSVLRGREIAVQRIRSATKFIEEEIGTAHPLADVDTKDDKVDVYVDFLGRLVNASASQVVLRPIVERYLDRIDRDERGLATRLYPITRDDDRDVPKLVVIDPRRRFGRPVIAGTNIETAVIAERFLAGESPDEIADDFGIDREAANEAVRFQNLLLRRHAA